MFRHHTHTYRHTCTHTYTNLTSHNMHWQLQYTCTPAHTHTHTCPDITHTHTHIHAHTHSPISRHTTCSCSLHSSSGAQGVSDFLQMCQIVCVRVAHSDHVHVSEGAFLQTHMCEERQHTVQQYAAFGPRHLQEVSVMLVCVCVYVCVAPVCKGQAGDMCACGTPCTCLGGRSDSWGKRTHTLAQGAHIWKNTVQQYMHVGSRYLQGFA
jgi:hypothetical protein